MNVLKSALSSAALKQNSVTHIVVVGIDAGFNED